jgi:hypothetical protein
LNGLVVQVSAKAELGNPLEHQDKALLHLIYVQEGLNPPLFGLWSFNSKAANFVSVSASLILWCFHLFCGFLTSFGFLIICGNINYFL